MSTVVTLSTKISVT